MNEDILKVTSVAFQNGVGKYSDMALQRPVVITRHRRPRTVMISIEEYERLKRRDRISFDPRELSAQDASVLLEALQKAVR